jgi:hypothetical protein
LFILEALEIPLNLATLLDETISPRAIGVESTRLLEDKKNFYNFIFDDIKGGAIFLTFR